MALIAARLGRSRRYLVGLVIAAIGAGLGWIGYDASRPQWILGNCTGTITTVPGVQATPCTPPPNVAIPPDLTAAMPWLVGGAVVALGLAATIWLLLTISERSVRHARDG